MSKTLFWNTLTSNGWIPDISDSGDDYLTYKMTILCTYECTIYARVLCYDKHIGLCSSLGVGWLEVEYENEDQPHSYNDLEDMLEGLNRAERNLLTIGVPFTPDYKFHSNNAKLTTKNNALRKKLHIEDYERKACEKEGILYEG